MIIFISFLFIVGGAISLLNGFIEDVFPAVAIGIMLAIVGLVILVAHATSEEGRQDQIFRNEMKIKMLEKDNERLRIKIEAKGTEQ